MIRANQTQKALKGCAGRGVQGWGDSPNAGGFLRHHLGGSQSAAVVS
jgi:hypothetical protein